MGPARPQTGRTSLSQGGTTLLGFAIALQQIVRSIGIARSSRVNIAFDTIQAQTHR